MTTQVISRTIADDRDERPNPFRAHLSSGGEQPGICREELTVSVVIPALNEAKNLPALFAKLPSTLDEVVLVDGHSTDGTIEVARSLRPGIRVVQQRFSGKGDAIASGLLAARGDVIVIIDADGSNDPAEIPDFVDAIRQGADFAKGSRFMAGGGSADITWLRKAGNRALTWTVNILYGTKYTDLCYGFNAVRSSCLDRLLVDCAGFEVETLMNIRVAKLSMRVAEIPSFESERVHGVSNLHPVRDGMRIFNVIMRERFSREIKPGKCVAEYSDRSEGYLQPAHAATYDEELVSVDEAYRFSSGLATTP